VTAESKSITAAKWFKPALITLVALVAFAVIVLVARTQLEQSSS
jgi:hypothetical protein